MESSSNNIATLFERRCTYCGTKKSNTPGILELQKCSGCYSARYCCMEHQKKHRNEHKKQCKEMIQRRESSHYHEMKQLQMELDVPATPAPR